MIVLREHASAKVNLYLHVTGKRTDGYHLLDSLVGFTDIADRLEVTPADELTLRLEGPYAGLLSLEDNSVLRAAELLRARTGAQGGASLVLHKELPVASGIGGGSADAAAAVRLLLRFWNVELADDERMDLALTLGADVPACLKSSSLYMQGIGERMEEGPPLSGMPVLLVNPGTPLRTPEVFAGFRPPFSSPSRHPKEFANVSACAQFLAHRRNDLEASAIALKPSIKEVITCLSEQEGCLLARMSGSGATCFGLFASEQTAHAAALGIAAAHAAWWVKAGSFL